ncbi:hemagglutinin repeat-containing protein [Collimonas fungivorans]|uniref:Filamentous hemagglutinin family outer membrane protein n=1 Tax=Collimonas fungivorans (strain Ter331) TaxID=1005048 RepID=G0ABJ9_COLFT|nr:hemagglutinin repeat-containing protein [Collimonas fungivorans]AEK61565.1 filamentous hemagglutinin family outer membrane protein [Collimonas fungivorans Ter331]
MNSQAYRVIFSKQRHALVVVAENVSNQTKGSGSQSGGIASWPLMRLVHLAVAVAALFGGVTAVNAQIVADPNAGGHRPAVGTTANGLPLVNIVAPNSSGLSHNQYNQFSVGSQGAILNNSPTISQTQQAGYVQGNPNLTNGSARIILNEVTGTSRSQLNGYIEVAGQRAQVIVANPNGISVAGGGFINTSRGVLTTGTPVLGSDGSLSGFRVTGGDIQIGSSGLSASNTDQLDLISRSVSVNGQLWANQLNVVTGTNQVNYSDLGVQIIAGDNNKPTVSIDIAQLGGMYANKIRLIGTEAGVGVASLGNVAAQAGDVNIDSQGKITLNGKTNATGGVTIHSADSVINTGTVYGQQAVQLSANGQIANSGTVAAQGDLTLFSGSINSTGVLGAGVDANGNASQAGSLNLIAAGGISATGQNLAGANVAMNGASLNLAHSQTSAAGNVALTARGGDIDHTGGNLQAAGAALNATGAVSNDQGQINVSQLTSNSAGLSNVGGNITQSGAGNTDITTTGALNNSTGIITTNGQNLAIRSASLNNNGGQINHAGAGAATIQSGATTNAQGVIGSNGQLILTAGSLNNQAGRLGSAGTANVHVTGDIGNAQGTMQSGGALTVAGNNIDNTTGTISSLNADGLVLTASGQLTNAANGVVGGNGDLNLSAGSVFNGGKITASNNLTSVVAGGVDNSNGLLAAGKNLTASAAAIKNANGTIDASNVTLAVPQLDNSNGKISSNQLTIRSANLTNQHGQISQFGSDLTTIAVAGALDNSNGGLLQINGSDLNISTQSLVNDSGTIAHAGSGTFAISDAGGLSNKNGNIATNGQLNLAAGSLNNQAGHITSTGQANIRLTGDIGNAQGTIQSGKALTVAGNNVDNAAGTVTSLSADGLTLTASGQLTNAASGIIGGNGDLNLSAGSVVNGGKITASNNLISAVASSFDNSNGLLAAGKNLTASAISTKNANGTIDAANVALTIPQLDNSSGKITGDQLAIHSTNLINQHGQISQFGNSATNIAVAGALDNSSGGLLQTNGSDLNITSQALVNDGGTIAHSGVGALTINNIGAVSNKNGNIGTNGQLSLTANSLNNQAGSITAKGLENIRVAGDIANALGTIQAGGALAAAGANVDNTAGNITSLNADGLTLTASGQLTNANAGTIAGNGDLALTAASAVNGGKITGKRNVTATVANSFDNSNGKLAAGIAVTVSAASFKNANGVVDAAAVALTVPQLDNSSGKITADQISIVSANLANQHGQIIQYGTAATTIAVGGTLDNSNGGLLQTNSADLSLTPLALNNTGGTIALSGSGALTISVANGAGSLSNAGGSIGGNGQTTVSAASIANQGGSVFAQNQLNVTASQGGVDNSAGGYIGGSSLNLNAAHGQINNSSGKIEGTQQAVTLNAQSLNNAGGTVQSIGAAPLNITTAQAISNTVANSVGGFIGGSGTVNLNAGSFDNSGGTVYGKNNLVLQSNGALTNNYGVIQGAASVTASAAGALNNANGRIEANGSSATFTVSGSGIDNTSGRIANTGNGLSQINGGSQVVNRQGTIGGNGELDINAGNLDNSQQGQVIAGGNLVLNTGGTVNNNAGNLYAGQNVQLNQGGAVLTNVGGRIGAAGNTMLNVASLDNTFGLVGSTSGAGSDIGIAASSFNNNLGTVASGRDLSITAPTIANNGKVVAGRDATINLQGDYANTAGNLLTANRNLTLNTTGNLINTGTLAAVAGLTLNAANVDNQSTGLINSSATTIQASNAITNTGRIYGDDIALGAQSLTNDVDVGSGQAGAIAARNSINIGAANVVNREHAIIQSLGDMTFARTLDANHKAVGTADSITNSSAIIDAGGNLVFQTVQLNNTNAHFATTQQVDPTQTTHVTQYATWVEPTVWYTPDQVTWSDSGDGGIVLVVPGNNRFEKFYKQDYTQTVSKTVVTSSDPGKISSGGGMVLSGNITNDKSTIIAGGTLSGTTGNINNIGATGTTDTVSHMTANENYYHYVDGHPHQNHYNYDNGGAAYDVALPSTPLALQVWTVQQNTAPNSGANPALGQGVGAIAVPTVGGLALGANQGSQTVTGPGGYGVTAAGGTAGNGAGADGNNQGIAAAGGTAGGSAGVGGSNQGVAAAGGTAGGGTKTSGNTQTVGSARNPLPNLVLPNNRLFTIQANPGQHFLVATDPAFTNYGNFLSSDYMLGLLGISPQSTEKRLGDGFYEQKLVNDQVAQLTGKRFLGDYASNEEEYKSLMEAGVATAKQFQLTPGIALTAEQMASLTSDIVWMVSQDVTLPDGSHAQVLAPVVYLTRADAGDIAPTGALISGKDIDLTINGTLKNGGTLQSSNNMIVQATDIANTGNIRSTGADGAVILVAQNDILNNGGSISGHRVGILAGRDVTMSTDAVSATGAQGTNIALSRVASVNADQLSVQAGRDINLVAAAVNTTGDAALSAGRDLNLTTVSTQRSYNVTYNSDNHLYENKTQVNGSAINAGGNLALIAGQDLNVAAATVNAGAQLAAVAGRDVNIGTAQQTSSVDQAIYTTSHGMLSSSSSRSQMNSDTTDAVGSSFTGKSIAIQSGRDTNVQGSQVIAKDDLSMNAGRDLNIVSAQQTSKDSFSAEEKKSGFSGSFLTGVSVGKNAQDQHQNGTSVNQIGSDISGGNVYTSSGRDTTITASAVTADNNIAINAGRDVNVLAAANTQTSQNDGHSSGTSIGVMGGANFRFTNYSNTSAEQNGSGNSATQSTSLISANGGNLSMQAGLDKQYKGTGQGNVTTQGAELLAKNQMSIGGNAVDLQAIQDSSSSQFHAETHSVTLGSSLTGAIGGALTKIGDMATESQNTSNDRLKGALALKAGYDAYKLASGASATVSSAEATDPNPSSSGGGIGISVNLGTSQSRQDSKNNATQARGTTAQASTIAITSREGDISMEGAKLQAQDISLDAAKNINLSAAKSTADLQSSNSGSSAGIGATLGSNGQQTGLSFQIGASVSKGHANGTETTYDNTQISATNQLSVKSGGDLNMKGAQLAGNKVTADVGGDLNIWTLQNVSNFDSKQESGGFSLSICVPPICVGQMVNGSVSFAKQTIDHNYQSAVGQSGIAAGNGGFDISVKGNTDLKGAAITSTATPDKNSLQTASLTYSDLTNTQHTNSESVSVSVSTGTVASNLTANVLGNLGGNTGMPKSGDETSSTNSVISPAKITITGSGDAQSQANATTLTSRDAATANQSLVNTLTLQQAQDLQAQQQKQQENQRAANLVGAVLTNVVGDIAQSNNLAEGSPEKMALHGIVGLIEAKIGGTSAAGGIAAAMGAEAMAPILSNYLLSQGYVNDPRDPAGQKNYNDMMNLGATLVGAASGALAGGSVQSANAGANTGLMVDANNRQLHPKEQALGKQLADASNGKYTQEQIDNALRRAGITGTSVYADKADIVPDVSKPGALYDAQNFRPAADGSKMFVETLAPIDPGVIAYVQAATGGSKSPYYWSDAAVAASSVTSTSYPQSLPPAPSGTYRASVVVNGVTYFPLVANCPAAGCMTGDSIASALGDSATTAYLSAVQKQAERDLNIGSAVLGVAGSAVRAMGTLAELGQASTAANRIASLLEQPLPLGKGTLTGDLAVPPQNASSDMVRSFARQNESAQTLANYGLKVEQLPETGTPGGNPDLKINGSLADVYAPTSKNVQTIADTLAYKVQQQAPNIVINLNDSILTSSQIIQQLLTTPVPGLNSVYFIKNGITTLVKF